MVELQGILRSAKAKDPRQEWVPTLLQPDYVREALRTLIAIGVKDDYTIWNEIEKSIATPKILIEEYPESRDILLELENIRDSMFEENGWSLGILADIEMQTTKAMAQRHLLIPTFLTEEGIPTAEGEKVLARKQINSDTFTELTAENGDWRHLQVDTEVTGLFELRSDKITHFSPRLYFQNSLDIHDCPNLNYIAGSFQNGLRTYNCNTKIIDVETGTQGTSTFEYMPELTRIAGTYKGQLLAASCPKLKALDVELLAEDAATHNLPSRHTRHHYVTRSGTQATLLKCPSLPPNKRFLHSHFDIEPDFKIKCLREAGKAALLKSEADTISI